MRGTVANLPSPHPIGPTLPAVYQEDAFSLRLAEALDELLAPVFATLDDFTAYLDPGVAPEDFLEWLAAWVGVSLDQTWPIERRRALVASAVDLYRIRGTAAGLASQIAIYTGGEVEITESGAAGWSSKAGATMPGVSDPFVSICVKNPRSRIPLDRLDALIGGSKPAHVPHTVEVAGQ